MEESVGERRRVLRLFEIPLSPALSRSCVAERGGQKVGVM
jgi:hypothetical protein